MCTLMWVRTLRYDDLHDNYWNLILRARLPAHASGRLGAAAAEDDDESEDFELMDEGDSQSPSPRLRETGGGELEGADDESEEDEA